MSVRSELITVTDTPPAPTRPAASNATVLQGGLAMASNAQVRLMTSNVQGECHHSVGPVK